MTQIILEKFTPQMSYNFEVEVIIPVTNMLL